MPTGTMTSKGQITVPREVREALGLTPGTTVHFIEIDGSWHLDTSPRRAARLSGMVAWSGAPVSLEAMDEAIAEGVTSRAST